MRNSTDRFINAVQTFLEKEFTKRATALHLEDIKTWDRGWNSSLNSMDQYPACLTFVESKSLVDCYTTEFAISIGLAVTADDNLLDELGNVWSDVLEDTIRSDWHLGGACLDSSFNSQISFGVAQGIYCIWLRLKCLVDIGGYVYEERTDAVSTMWASGEEEPTEPTVLSTMRGDDGAGEEEREQESAVELI